LLGILCIALTGCGTLTRVLKPAKKKEEMLYPATHATGSLLAACFTPRYSDNYTAGILTPFAIAYLLTDMPVSIAVDTVLFPYDWHRYRHYDDYVRK
jgi:uncharacterized protein YceK